MATRHHPHASKNQHRRGVPSAAGNLRLADRGALPAFAGALPGAREVAGAMRALASGQAGTRVRLTPGNGLGDLCRAFNEMAEELERQSGELRREKEALAAKEKEKDTLLREIHHRVKNNLQVVTGLLELQTSALLDPAARQACRESQGRIRAMALTHEGLYRHRDLVSVRMDRYIQQLASQLLRAYGRGDGSIDLTVKVEGELCLPAETVTPLGLVLNELVSNSLKHAFPGGRKGAIRVSLAREKDGLLSMVVEDDGVGLPQASRVPDEGASLGMRLVSMLVEQMRGTLRAESHGGSRFTLTLPAPEPRPLPTGFVMG